MNIPSLAECMAHRCRSTKQTNNKRSSCKRSPACKAVPRVRLGEVAPRSTRTPLPAPPAAPAPHLGVHIGQAVPAELVEEPLALEVVYDHGNELRVPGASPRASRPARSGASPGTRRRRRRLGLRWRRRRRGRRRLWLRVGGHGVPDRGARARAQAGRRSGEGGYTGPAA